MIFFSKQKVNFYIIKSTVCNFKFFAMNEANNFSWLHLVSWKKQSPSLSLLVHHFDFLLQPVRLLCKETYVAQNYQVCFLWLKRFPFFWEPQNKEYFTGIFFNCFSSFTRKLKSLINAYTTIQKNESKVLHRTKIIKFLTDHFRVKAI